ncbi:RNA polymerase-binding protein DksA [Tahibacter soli]|uniref:RNA polymerase-binding transcription factor DksA n=1 Tax=Tahibacter soli TaxID=2983605 RepID=A0A9X3YPM2_9GAMM|nr:RNA polymerase-binding protein DksA [Tahibacter soli]MDC8015145.1 RNA polymerase-binding protein DksA [Tahibacter soli]
MAKSSLSSARKPAPKGKAAGAKGAKIPAATRKKVVAKVMKPLAKTAKAAAKSTKPGKPTKPVKAAKPPAKSVKPLAKPKPAAKKAKTAATVKTVKPAAKSIKKAETKSLSKAAVNKAAPVAVPKPAAKPAAKPVEKAAPAATKVAAPAAAAKSVATAAPAPKPATSPVPAPQPTTSKPVKQVITEESKKTSRKGVIAPTASETGITMEGGRYALAATTNIDLPPGYRPSSDEEYMNPMHLAFFRNKLREWRDQLVEESKQTIDNLREEVRDIGDEAERATRETENSLELRTRDRYRKLIAKIDKALKRIEEGRYGYCEETDEDIGLERLEARPIATLCLDAQERWEHRQRQMGD